MHCIYNIKLCSSVYLLLIIYILFTAPLWQASKKKKKKKIYTVGWDVFDLKYCREREK